MKTEDKAQEIKEDEYLYTLVDEFENNIKKFIMQGFKIMAKRYKKELDKKEYASTKGGWSDEDKRGLFEYAVDKGRYWYSSPVDIEGYKEEMDKEYDQWLTNYKTEKQTKNK